MGHSTEIKKKREYVVKREAEISLATPLIHCSKPLCTTEAGPRLIRRKEQRIQDERMRKKKDALERKMKITRASEGNWTPRLR